MKGMHVLTGLNILIWGGLIFLGYNLIDGVVAQKVVGYPNFGQITYYLYAPIVMVAVAVVTYLFSRLGRFIGLLLAIQTVVLLAFFPYILAYTGGV